MTSTRLASINRRSHSLHPLPPDLTKLLRLTGIIDCVRNLWPIYFSLLLLLGPPALGEDAYRATFAPDLSSVDVQACFAGSAPRRLTTHERADDFLQQLYADQRRIQPRFRWNRLYLPRLGADSCIRYRIDLAAAASTRNWRLASLNSDWLLTDTRLWLWPPSPPRSYTVELILPQGMNASTPWRELSRQGNAIGYQPDISPSTWGSRVAVGRFRTENLTVGGSQLHVATVGRISRQQHQTALRWLRESAQAVSNVYGHFPQPRAQMLIVGIGSQREPIPWAQVMRGGGVAAHFFVDQSRSFESFSRDWTATHELAHMLIPFVTSRDRWLSEGLASYYQNVLRARDGRLSEQRAWQKLHDGFRRGQRRGQGIALADASREMRQSGAYMRVYWSGAAILLKADTALRQRSNGVWSLDKALKQLHQCCIANTRSWTAAEIFSRLDRISGDTVFMELYRRNIPSTRFPDVTEEFRQLGINVRGRRLSLDDSAAEAAIRRNIMQP